MFVVLSDYCAISLLKNFPINGPFGECLPSKRRSKPLVSYTQFIPPMSVFGKVKQIRYANATYKKEKQVNQAKRIPNP